MRVTYEAVQAFLFKFNQGQFPHQRLGQAFVNELNLPSPHPLFYEEDDKITIRAIWDMVAKENDDD